MILASLVRVAANRVAIKRNKEKQQCQCKEHE